MKPALRSLQLALLAVRTFGEGQRRNAVALASLAVTVFLLTTICAVKVVADSART